MRERDRDERERIRIENEGNKSARAGEKQSGDDSEQQRSGRDVELG